MTTQVDALGLVFSQEAVHVVDGRGPHSVVVELFTEKGVGTLVTG